MATPSDDSEDDDFVLIGTPVPELSDDQPLQKPTTIQDLTARDKQGRRRFHGAFTGGFSAGYFNTVGSKEGFTPSTFLSSRKQKSDDAERTAYRPEDFMDEEDLEEHGIAPRKFATAMGYTSEERKRKRLSELQQVTSTSGLDIAPALVDLIVPEQIPIGIQLLHKMGWREGQGLGPRKRKKKNLSKLPKPSIKMYGCAMPPSDSDQSDSDEFVPQNLKDIKFAPKDVCPISLDVKNDVHGLGYHGIDSSLALPGSHINLFQTPTAQYSKNKKGILGEAFGVGVFEEEDENIYTMDSLSNYDITMQLDEEVDNKFGWTAPRQHGKQQVPVTYVGKLLEGFCLSSKPLQPKKKYPPPTLHCNFKPLHWFRKKRALSHLPDNLKNEANQETPKKLTAVDRGILLGETPIMKSVFDLVQKEDMDRIEATKQAIAMTQSLKDIAKHQLSSKFQTEETSNNPPVCVTAQTEHPKGNQQSSFVSKFKPADSAVTAVTESEAKKPASNVPLFQGSLNFQPFRKDPAKQERYYKYLMHLKQGDKDPYTAVTSSHLTEWEKSREREEFGKASKIFRPMSAMMSSRFVGGAMIDDEQEQGPSNSIQNVVNDQSKAAEMGMFGQLTHEVFEWHPNSLLCKRFNVPNPYPGSDVTGVPSVKRDKFSVFNFLNFNDSQSQDATVEKESEPIPIEKTMKPVKKTTMASVFKVLDDPSFNMPTPRVNAVEDKKEHTDASVSDSENPAEDEESKPPDMDLFRAIFKNSDSEDSSEDATADIDKGTSSSEDEKSEENEVVENVPDDELTNSDINSSEKQLRSSDKPMEISNVSANINFAVCSRSPTLSKRKSRFSDLLEEAKDIIDEGLKATAVDPQKEDVLSRLSVSNEEADDEYGPKLPSYLDVSSRLSSDSAVATPEVKHVPDRHSETHRERHKQRKEKKKKSKHKKNKKHKKHKKKSSKMKKVKREDSGSGDEADTESDSDTSND